MNCRMLVANVVPLGARSRNFLLYLMHVLNMCVCVYAHVYMYLFVCAVGAKMYCGDYGVPLAIHRGPGRVTFGFGLTLISRG